MMRPALTCLSDGATHPLQHVRDRVAEALEVSAEDQALLLASGKQTRYANRVAWAMVHMEKARVVSRPSRGQYAITARGVEVLKDGPERITMNTLLAFPEYVAFRSPRGLKHADEPADTAIDASAAELSPSEAIDRLVRAAEDAIAGELLERLLAEPPVFLERISLRLLQAMGYGGRESLVEHTGRSGDAGLDGIVRQDALGLDLVGVQAKRYAADAAVGRPEIQAFVGALQGAQTSRGVFITTGRFSPGARQFADSVAMRLVLLDGHELAQLMVRYGVGVAVRETFDLKQVDEEFFEQ